MTTQPDRGHGLTVGAVVADTYQVTRLLGRGGMGAVWEASHLRLPGKRVAIKVLHADIAADKEALARFRREAEIASRLGHPNIVEVHDFNTLPDGKPYLVLELLVGESLDSRLRRAPVSLDDAMRIAAQIGAALAAAHREQVVHRDLKPQNVFLVRPRDDEGSEVVKVLDFGISKIRGSTTVKTLETTLLGTPQYMSPEQATGNHGAVDQRTDVFALGAIVYEMLVGRPAFTGQSIPEVVFKVVYEQPAPLAELVPGLPARVAEAVERALSKAQDDRFPDVVTFIEEMAGVSLSTLRRAPISLAPPRPTPATGMESTMAAPSTDRSRARGDQAPDGAVADPLARTVDSGRRELAHLLPAAAPSPPPRSLPQGLLEGRTESMRGPMLPRRPGDPGAAGPTPRDPGAPLAGPTPRDLGAPLAGPTPRDPGAPLAEPTPRVSTAEVASTTAARRRGRRLALLAAAVVLVGAGSATTVLVARSGERGQGRAESAARGERARSARRAAGAADDHGDGAARQGGGATDDPVAAASTGEPGAIGAGGPGDEGSGRAGGEAAEPSSGAAAPTTPGSTAAGVAATGSSAPLAADPTSPGVAASSGSDLGAPAATNAAASAGTATTANPASSASPDATTSAGSPAATASTGSSAGPAGTAGSSSAGGSAAALVPSTGATTATSPADKSAPGRAGAAPIEPGDPRASRPVPSVPRRTRPNAHATEGDDAVGRPAATTGSSTASAEARGEIGAALAGGEQALRDGDFRRAVVLAERAVRHGGGPAAHALHARASCGIGDLGNAKASFLRIPHRNRALRRIVAAACSRAGIDLGR